MERLSKRFVYKTHEVVIATALNDELWTWRYSIDGLQTFVALSFGHWTEVTAVMEAMADARRRIDEMP